jgi:hypothetical protein
MKRRIMGAILIAVLIASVSTLINKEMSSEQSVYDESYIYEITNVNDNELRGKALNHISDDNMGIFLYTNKENGFSIGDKISIIWGKDNKVKSIKTVAE